MIDIDLLPLRQPFGAVIAAALYTSTYAALLNLLRYPRNWLPPSVAASVVTGLLGLLTIVFVSVSTNTDGYALDIKIVLFSSVFLLALFTIIVSPAIDFNPGSRPFFEYLANRGDTAGVWMLLPAVIGAYALPDSKLHGLLSAAMTLELVWYVRCRWTRKRRLYTLDAHDTLVLNTQANGHIKEFAKKNHIQELNFAADGIQWSGCNKETLPCPFNFYTNRLGLNTAPCCREHMKDLAYFVSSSLKEMGIVHWLEGGSLLGAVRENGNLLAWEDDVDISFLLDDDVTWSSITRQLSERGKRDGYYIDIFKTEGLISISYDRSLPWPFRWERNRMRGEIRLDLVAYRRAVSHGKAVIERNMEKGAMPMTESGWYGLPEELVLPTSTIRFLGDDIPCPNQPQLHLRTLYQDYQTIEYMYVSSDVAKIRSAADTA